MSSRGRDQILSILSKKKKKEKNKRKVVSIRIEIKNSSVDTYLITFFFFNGRITIFHPVPIDRTSSIELSRYDSSRGKFVTIVQIANFINDTK